VSVPDVLNLFTGGWFEETPGTHDDVLALFTDGWFDLGFIAIVKRFRSTIGMATIVRSAIGMSTISRQDLGISTIQRVVISG